MIRKVDRLYHATSRSFIAHIHEINLIKQPFSDKEILETQEKFLTNGFQYLKAQNIEQGRKIIYTFLKSLAVYHEVACLTFDASCLPRDITDIYTELLGGDYLNPHEPYYLEEYFIEYFYFDFLWIEATQAMLLSPWFEEVKKNLMRVGIDQQIPILVVVYADQD